MERLIVDNNLNRYAYEGVSRHLDIKDKVKALWKEYKNCLKKAEKEKKDEAIAAKQCANNKNESEEKKPTEEN